MQANKSNGVLADRRTKKKCG